MSSGKKTSNFTNLMVSVATGAVIAPTGVALAESASIVVSGSVDDSIELSDAQSSITVTRSGAVLTDNSAGAIYFEAGTDAADLEISNHGVLDNEDGAAVNILVDGDVTRNTVLNTGTMSSYNDNVIDLWSEFASVTLNEIENAGDLLSDDTGDGISLSSDGVSDDLEIHDVAHNTIRNTGRINAAEDGIFLEAYDGVTGNNIINSGTIIADDEGIDFSSDIGDMSENEVTNSGTIVSGDDAIEMTTDATLTANIITNSGTLTAYTDDGIIVRGQNGLAGNVITNTGNITSEDEDGINVESDFDAISANVIRNASGATITSLESAVAITSESDILSNSVVNNGNMIVTGDFDEDASGETLDDFAGISLFIDDSQDGAIAYNSLENTGLIDAGVSGMTLISATNSIYENSLLSTGDIVAGFDGMSLFSRGSTVVDNEIVNRGDIASGVDGVSLVSGYGGLGFLEYFGSGEGTMNAEVDGNTVLNSGNIVVGLDDHAREQSLLVDFFGEDGSPTAVDFSAFALFEGFDLTSMDEETSAIISGNRVTNSGLIDGDVGGLSMTSMALNGGATTASSVDSPAPLDGDALASAVISTDIESDVAILDNDITNSGRITSNGAGIALTTFVSVYSGADADATATAESVSFATASADADATSVATATSTIVRNTIENTGIVDVSDATEPNPLMVDMVGSVAAISLIGLSRAEAVADADAAADAYADSDDANPDTGAGEEFGTVSSTAQAAATATSSVEISDNEINNSGALIGAEAGILIVGIAEGTAVAIADATGGEFVDATAASGSARSFGTPDVSALDPEVEDVTVTVANNTIVNSGAIVGLGGTAISFGGSSDGGSVDFRGNAVELVAPAFLGGEVYLGDASGSDSTSLQITTGPSHSVLWHISGDLAEVGEDSLPIEVIADGVPYWLITNGDNEHTFASFDATVASSSTQQFSEAQALVRDAAADGARVSPPGSSAPFVVARGGFADFDGNGTNTLAYDTQQSVLLGGLNLSGESGIHGQAYIGQIDSTATAAGSISFDVVGVARSFTREASGTIAGASLSVPVGRPVFEFGLNAADTDVDIRRLVNANLVNNGVDGSTRTDGLGWADGQTQASWIAPSIGVSGTFALGEGLTITPSARASFMNVTIDAYEETTSSIDTGGQLIDVASIGQQEFDVIEAEVGVSLTRQVNEELSLSYGGGFVNRTIDATSVNVTMFDANADLISDATQAIGVSSSDVFAPYVAGRMTFTSGNAVFELSGRAQSANGNLSGSIGAQLRIDF